ncbi:hypothetical protein ACFLRF_01285 [Candidatus Altiarchaeota archaeon]
MEKIIKHPVFRKPICPLKGCQHKHGLCIHDWIIVVLLGYGMVFMIFWLFGIIQFNI